jgi:hypothetical protein
VFNRGHKASVASRLRRLLSAALLVPLAAALTTGVAFATPPSSPPGYLADDYSSMRLDSNNLWSFATAVGKSYRTGLFPKAAPETTTAVWGKTCPKSAQTVTFSRNVWLPGPPSTGAEFSFAPLVGQSTYLAPRTVDLIVNGETIVHERALALFHVTLSATALKAFRFEQNYIQVRVHKRKTHGRCNTGDPATQLGVSFGLSGDFGTDLAFNAPTPDTYFKLPPGQSKAVTATAEFHNYGPDWDTGGKFQLNVDGAPQFVLGTGGAVPPPSAPLTGCQQSDNGLSHIVTCGLTDFAPGTDGSLSSIFQVTAPSSDYSDFSVIYSLYISPGPLSDPNRSNNTTTHVFVFCGSKSTKPGCQSAS